MKTTKSVKVEIRLTPEEKELLTAAAERRDISVSQLIRESYREVI